MRIAILKDEKITPKELKSLTDEFSAFIKEHVGITPDYYIHTESYKNVPTGFDADGDTKPTDAYMRGLINKVHNIYGTYGVDSVVVLVHRDHWTFKGIWGSNFSNVYHQYHVHLCRFDNRNQANSLGTLYHEWMHCLDALIKVHTGVEIDNLFKHTTCFVDWDSTVVHANRFRGCKETPFQYIRWKENIDALESVAPHIRNAYRVRKELYLEPYKHVQRYFISWLRSFLNKKNGVPRGT